MNKYTETLATSMTKQAEKLRRHDLVQRQIKIAARRLKTESSTNGNRSTKMPGLVGKTGSRRTNKSS
jgi:hypothetical protein